MASIAMSYGYVYVAQIAMGADYNQAVKAIAEAEAYPGPSLIIAYAPCINHGIKKGMSKAQTEEQLAVEAGYWHCFRFNPALAAEGKDPGGLVDPVDHRFAQHIGQRLARHPGTGVARRDHSDCFHGCTSLTRRPEQPPLSFGIRRQSGGLCPNW